MAYWTFISPTTLSSRASLRVYSSRSLRWAPGISTEGRTHELSPEWMPASSMCCITPAITTSSPSERASTSISSRSEEHTSELQSRLHLVCRLLLEKKKETESDRT